MEITDPIPEDRILVAGRASRSVAADRAVWRLVVVEEGDAAARAFARCAERLDALTHALRDGLGDDAEVRTGALSVEPKHDARGRPLATVSVTGQVAVDVALADAGRAAGAAIASGADRLHGPMLVVRARDAIGDELLRDAVTAARRKAERIADAAARPLGRVVSVVEDAERVHYAVRASAVSLHGYDDDGPDLAPAEHEISATVHVVFALDD